MHIAIPTPPQKAINMLNNAGFEAYIVGGCVRDSLLGKQPGDWDITTSALPEQVQAVFADYRTILTGVQHGTVTVVFDETPLEITTYRVDGDYADNRHPLQVLYTPSLKEDLQRRDFTINAMAYHPEIGLVDHYSGMADLSAGRIACVGDPEQRFTEDALRILRALRFSSTLDFPIEKMTAAAAHRLAPLLRRISSERIAAELTKLLCGKGVKRVLLEHSAVLGVVLPELAASFDLQQVNPWHYLTVYEHTAETVAAIPPVPHLRWTMLLHDVGKPACYTRDAQGIDHFSGHPEVSAAMAEQAMTRLKMDNQTIATVKKLIMHHDDYLTLTDKSLLRVLNRLGVEGALDMVDIQRADVVGQHPDKRDRLTYLDEIEKRLRQLIAEKACFSMADLAVNGDDLLKLGYQPGRKLGDVLHSLLEAVMDGTLPNESSALVAKANDMM